VVPCDDLIRPKHAVTWHLVSDGMCLVMDDLCHFLLRVAVRALTPTLPSAPLRTSRSCVKLASLSLLWPSCSPFPPITAFYSVTIFRIAVMLATCPAHRICSVSADVIVPCELCESRSVFVVFCVPFCFTLLLFSSDIYLRTLFPGTLILCLCPRTGHVSNSCTLHDRVCRLEMRETEICAEHVTRE
jgi:hypothetical protein